MNDRELLEKAARAAGYTGFGYSNNFGDYSLGDPYSRTEARWNPLTNDADAFRLVVDLGVDLSISKKKKIVKAVNHKTECIIVSFKLGDKHAATRRAIVLAAAAMVDTGGGEDA
jgi:hypothetical protein